MRVELDLFEVDLEPYVDCDDRRSRGYIDGCAGRKRDGGVYYRGEEYVIQEFVAVEEA